MVKWCRQEGPGAKFLLLFSDVEAEKLSRGWRGSKHNYFLFKMTDITLHKVVIHLQATREWAGELNYLEWLFLRIAHIVGWMVLFYNMI